MEGKPVVGSCGGPHKVGSPRVVRSFQVLVICVMKMDPRPIYFGFWCLMTNTTKLD